MQLKVNRKVENTRMPSSQLTSSPPATSCFQWEIYQSMGQSLIHLAQRQLTLDHGLLSLINHAPLVHMFAFCLPPLHLIHFHIKKKKKRIFWFWGYTVIKMTKSIWHTLVRVITLVGQWADNIWDSGMKMRLLNRNVNRNFHSNWWSNQAKLKEQRIYFLSLSLSPLREYSSPPPPHTLVSSTELMAVGS